MIYSLDTYEGIVDHLLKKIRQDAGSRLKDENTDWNEYLRLSEIIHGNFEIPSTSISSFMSKFLFAIGHSLMPRRIIGAGTYVGYAFSWLVGRNSEIKTYSLDEAVAFDVDESACAIAIKNLANLEHGEKLKVFVEDAKIGIGKYLESMDLLYIDIDDPLTRKKGYVEVLSVAMSKITSGGFVLAHDPCVEVFKEDFKRYHKFIERSGNFAACWIFPVDDCGLSIAIKK